MKINIVRTEGSWVIGNITENYAKRLPNCSIQPVGFNGPSDINIYMTWAAYRGPTNAIDVPWFTHRENAHFDKVASMADHCIAMSNKTGALLPQNKTTVIVPGVEPQFSKDKIVFGCVGRNYPTNRKKFNWISQLEKIPNTEFRFTNGSVAWEDMPAFYKNIDYLLILSENEGGPMPVLEALAGGKPIIAPDVGWAWEVPCIKYNGYDQLEKIVKSMVLPKNSWDISARRMLKLCEDLVK